jgi:ABC-type uncharacterized transport system permease subunit
MNQPATEKGNPARSLLSIAVGLVLAGILMQASGYNALGAFSALWIGATGLQAGPAALPSDIVFGSGHLDSFLLAQSLAKVTPLLFCGLAVALGLRAGLFNIGAQGQMTVGALAAASMGLIGSASSAMLPAPLHIVLTLLAGTLAGAAWGAIPGLLKAWRGVHEVITTIMLNFIGINVVTYIASHNLKDPESQNVQTTKMAATAWLTPLVPHSNLTLGLLLAVLMAVGLTFLIARTSLGYAIRAVGSSPEAAEAAGISTARTLVITMALSGALAGMAGAVEVMGIHHRYVDGVAGNYGFDGIAVALLGGIGGSGAILSALFFGLLASGSQTMETLTHVPAPISVVVQAVVIIFVCMRYHGRLFVGRKARSA